MAQICQSAVGEDHGGLRCLERFPRFEPVIEPLRLDALRDPYRSELVHGCRAAKRPAVEEGKTHAGSVVFVCPPIRENHERIILVAGRASAAADSCFLVPDMQSLGRSLTAVPAFEMNEIPFPAQKVDRSAGSVLKNQGVLPGIDDPGCPGNCIRMRENAVKEFHMKAGAFIPEKDRQGGRIIRRIRLIRMKAGETVQSVYSAVDPMILISQVASGRTICSAHAESCIAIVAAPFAGIFEGHDVSGDAAVRAGIVRVPRKAPVPPGDRITHIARDARTIIGMHEKTARSDLHLVAGVVCM